MGSHARNLQSAGASKDVVEAVASGKPDAAKLSDRDRALLVYVPADKLSLTPDCGFFQLPRWLTVLKLRSLVEGTKIVRRELTGREASR